MQFLPVLIHGNTVGFGLCDLAICNPPHSLSPEVGCDDCEMTSLATIRTQNIARNERFLAALFGHERTGSSNSSLPADIIDPNDTKVISVAEDDEYCEPTSSIDLAVDEKERLHKIDSLEHIKNFTFHFRKDEINRVLGYLDRSLAPAPSLLVTGAAGTGKSVCTQHALSTFDVPGSYTTFLGLSDSKQVIRQICYDVRACINKMVTSRSNRTNKAGSSKVGSQSTQPWNQENKIPNSFSDLSKYFFAILESKTYQWPVLNVILDRLDLIDHLEAGLSIKMLKLGELSHPKLKVIAISRIPNFQIFSGLHLIFRPYSDHQIEAIIKNKAAEVCCSNYVGEPSGKSAHTSAIMSHFSKVIRHSLPRLLLRTRHVGVLWEECLSIWRGLMAQDFHEFCIDYKGDVFDITLPAYKAANLGIIKMPIANVKGNKLASIIPAGKAFIKSSTGKRELLIDEPLCMGPILMTVNTKLNLDTFQGAKWCDHLTHNTKYLILAAFLASNNPKETDDHTFGVNNKRGKRKKKKMGTESDEGSNSTNRSFSIERLMSIFSQIVCINGNKNMGILSDMKGKSNKSSSNTKAFYLEVQNTYGDSDLFSAVSTLVLQKYLLLGPGWTLEHPTYYSTVSQEMAEEVANALHPRFHLHDFMYSAKEC